MPRIFKFFGYGLLFVGVLLYAVGVFRNSYRLDMVDVSLNAGSEEHKDRQILGIGGADADPDYRVLVRAGSQWYDLGVQNNTKIGSGISFKCNEDIPFRLLSELRFEDDDKFEDDVLEQMPISGPTLAGNRYSFVLVEEFDIQAGISWFFFGTAVGKILAAGVILGMVFVIFSYC